MHKLKQFISFLLFSSLFLGFSMTTFAEEPLLDNNLDLKTDRLNNKQSGAGTAENFSLDERLFNEVEAEKLEKATELEEANKEKEQAELFTQAVPKLQNELETENLFISNENNDVAMKREEAVKTASSPASFLPLILFLAVVTAGILIWNQFVRKRGEKHGREQRAY